MSYGKLYDLVRRFAYAGGALELQSLLEEARSMCLPPEGLPPRVIALCAPCLLQGELTATAARVTHAGDIALLPVVDDAGLQRSHLDLADEILVLNPYGYVDPVRQAEAAYARGLGKPVVYSHPLRPG